MQNNYDLEYNIITLGESGVGKTSIINRYVDDTFNNDEISTFGIKRSFKIYTVNNGKNLKINLIDTGGQEKYRSLSVNYFRNVDVVLFVFDLNQKLSFENLQIWINYFNENNNGKYVKEKFLIGNKNDLENNVEKNLIDEFSKKNKLIYWEISAKTSYQINELFQFIADELYEKSNKRCNSSVRSQRIKSISRNHSFNDGHKKSSCC